MRGRLAVAAEVVGSRDEGAAEVVLPEAVHEDARGKGVVRAGDPAGQVEAALWLSGQGSGFRVQGSAVGEFFLLNPEPFPVPPSHSS